MDELVARSRAQRHTGRRRPANYERRPDRVALWAVFLGLFAMVAAATSAHAATTGGVSDDVAVPPVTGDCPAVELGTRPLEVGDCGSDVQTLNWLLKSKPVGAAVVPDLQFGDSTAQAVMAFQHETGLSVNGVVDSTTRKALKKSMTKGVASWYGPGFFGNETSCGQTLTKTTVGVAHRELPCGTNVTLFANGHWATAQVIDRGPFVKGVGWDLTQALAQQLGVTATEKVRVAVAG